MKKIIYAAVLVFFALTISGCGAKTPYTERQVLNYAEQMYGDDITYNGSETAEDGSTDGVRYHFTAKEGFSFSMVAGRSMDGYFPIYYRTLGSDYVPQMLDFYAPEIEKLSEGSGINYEIGNDSVDLTINQYTQLNNAVIFLERVKSLISDSLPDLSYDTPVHIYDTVVFAIEARDEEDKEQHIIVGELGELPEKDLALDYARIRFLQYVREEDLPDNGVEEQDYKKYPPVYITDFYINGEAFISDKYEAVFTYSPKDREYLAIVAYGIELEYNGGVADYLQREIVTDYLGGVYHIDAEQQESQYTIGNDEFEVSLPREEDVLPDATFKKNGKKLDIELCEGPLYWGSTEATYNYYMKLSDYAELLNMDYRVDIENEAVYLTSR